MSCMSKTSKYFVHLLVKIVEIELQCTDGLKNVKLMNT